MDMSLSDTYLRKNEQTTQNYFYLRGFVFGALAFVSLIIDACHGLNTFDTRGLSVYMGDSIAPRFHNERAVGGGVKDDRVGWLDSVLSLVDYTSIPQV